MASIRKQKSGVWRRRKEDVSLLSALRRAVTSLAADLQSAAMVQEVIVRAGRHGAEPAWPPRPRRGRNGLTTFT